MIDGASLRAPWRRRAGRQRSPDARRRCARPHASCWRSAGCRTCATAAQCGARRGAGGSQRSRTGASCRIFVAVLPANTLTPKRGPAADPRRRSGPGGLDAGAVRVAPDRGAPHARRRAGRPARHRPQSRRWICAAFKPRRADDAFDPDPVPRARACVAELAAQGRRRRAVHDHRVDRRPRGGARGARLSRAGTCGAAATARASRSSTCAGTPSACAALVLDGVAPPDAR